MHTWPCVYRGELDVHTLVWTRGPTTPEKLAAFSKAKLALDQASARCSQIAQEIAEL
jgi:hypothetical protein